jgi:hypothetical protein
MATIRLSALAPYRWSALELSENHIVPAAMVDADREASWRYRVAHEWLSVCTLVVMDMKGCWVSLQTGDELS